MSFVEMKWLDNNDEYSHLMPSYVFWNVFHWDFCVLYSHWLNFTLDSQLLSTMNHDHLIFWAFGEHLCALGRLWYLMNTRTHLSETWGKIVGLVSLERWLRHFMWIVWAFEANPWKENSSFVYPLWAILLTSFITHVCTSKPPNALSLPKPITNRHDCIKR